MIKWNCNFNIPDATIQVAEAFIKVNEFNNVNDHCVVNISIIGETEDILIKNYNKDYTRNFSNEDEIYEELLTEFENSQLA